MGSVMTTGTPGLEMYNVNKLLQHFAMFRMDLNSKKGRMTGASIPPFISYNSIRGKPNLHCIDLPFNPSNTNPLPTLNATSCADPTALFKQSIQGCAIVLMTSGYSCNSGCKACTTLTCS